MAVFKLGKKLTTQLPREDCLRSYCDIAIITSTVAMHARTVTIMTNTIIITSTLLITANLCLFLMKALEYF